MSSVNRVILVGNVGKAPDVRHLDSGSVVAKFSLATNETFTDKSGKKVTTTEWHNIVVWGKLAEVVEKYVKVGMTLFIDGKIKTESYDDKEGNKKYITTIICNEFKFLGGGEQSKEKTEDKETETSIQEPAKPDDLPF